MKGTLLMHQGLEGEPESDLHYSRSTLNGRQVSEAWIPGRAKGVNSLSEAIDSSETLSIGHIKYFPAYFHLLVLAPGHFPGLRQTKVKHEVARISEDIAITSLTRTTTAETLVGRIGIGE